MISYSLIIILLVNICFWLFVMLDVNECENNPCHSTGTCVNTPGKYVCVCPQGYYGDGWRTGCFPSKLNKLSIGTFQLI